MFRPALLLGSLLVSMIPCAVPMLAAPKLEAWTDTDGNRFHGTPAEIIGPLALFRTGPATGRRLPLSLLEPKDCVRFHDGVAGMPERATSWSDARGALSRELRGRVGWSHDGTLTPADLAALPEPEFFVLFFASHNEGGAWEMMGAATAPFLELRQTYPGMVEGLYYGLRHNAAEHARMATEMRMPWLVAQFATQSELEIVTRFAPENGFGLVVTNRDGVPLLASSAGNKEKVASVMADLANLLQMMRPDNSRAWADRLHFFRAVQSAKHRRGQCPPLLIGDPLDVDALRQRSVHEFQAAMQIDENGAVQGVTVEPSPELAPKLVTALEGALRRAAFVPAVRNGGFVAGDYTYRFKIEP